MNNSVIIVAGGSGKRMGSEIPKQFLLLQGKPILMHTISRFYNWNNDIEIIVVLPANQIQYWKDLCRQQEFLLQHKVVSGGDTRFESVQNGLNHMNKTGFVAIHDGVRPFVSNSTISNCFKIAKLKNNAIPVIPINESIREISNSKNKAVPRSSYRIVQTPQVFEKSLIIEAYQQDNNVNLTDDASVVEALNVKINLVVGNHENIKITNPIDLYFAEAIYKEFYLNLKS